MLGLGLWVVKDTVNVRSLCPKQLELNECITDRYSLACFHPVVEL